MYYCSQICGHIDLPGLERFDIYNIKPNKKPTQYCVKQGNKLYISVTEFFFKKSINLLGSAPVIDQSSLLKESSAPWMSARLLPFNRHYLICGATIIKAKKSPKRSPGKNKNRFLEDCYKAFLGLHRAPRGDIGSYT